ncbi:unnamed protein product [Polarella glacialis]|uniref:Uncharacterized protein n=1 Tax=Polarella glacialis TaxID=89957 RepID=A0A813ED99_POLGL|nr:unnamed protein product [Polarella glacialis]CAE8738991.1 unnamed protein product [Polarella glacialis]
MGGDKKGSEDRGLDLMLLFAPQAPEKPDDPDLVPLSEARAKEQPSPVAIAVMRHFGTEPFVPITMWAVWLCIAGFVAIQLGTYALTGDSFFGTITGGVVESLRLSTGVPMTWHMMTGSAMWTLGFVQIMLKNLRHGSLAWVHRLSGVMLLLLWFFVVGPTAAWLSLHVGVGNAGAQWAMMIFAVVGMDSTSWASYYMMRGLIVIRRRARGSASIDLHSRLMRMGLTLTMLILFQRPLQFIGICIRFFLQLLSYVFPTDSWLARGLQGFVHHALDHNVILSVTTMHPQALLFFVFDGPRSEIALILVGINPQDYDEMVEAFGSAEPYLLEKLFWRLRYLLFFLLRYHVTNGFTVDPVHKP